MRALRVLAIVCFAPALIAAAPTTPEPVEPPSKKTPPPEPKKELPPYIASARRSLGIAGLTNATYEAGPLAYDVEIVNPTRSPLETTLVVERLDGSSTAAIARVPVKVPPTDRASVTFSDPTGLKDGCSATRLRLALENGSSTRTLKTTPACTFTTETIAEVGAQAARRGRLHYHSASLVTPAPTCGGAFTVRATVKNDAGAPVENAKLRLDGPNVDASSSFDLAAAKEKVLTVSIAAFAGASGAYALKIDTPATVPVHQGGWSAKVARSCKLEIDLER